MTEKIRLAQNVTNVSFFVLNVMEKPEDRSITEPGVKPGTSDGGKRPEQTTSLLSVENPSLNLRTFKLPVNVGVPYSPNKKIVNKSSTDTTDNTPHPTNKPDDSTAADSEMFVDLSPLDYAPQIVRGLASRQERHPMSFTPPSFSLGISQNQPVVQDPMPVTFAFPEGMAAMMVQPMVEGRKAIKFAAPIVQGTFLLRLSFSCVHLCSLTFVPSNFFGVLTYHGNCYVMPWQLDLLHHDTYIFVAMLYFPFGKHMATEVGTTWQLYLFPHGSYSALHMATGFATACHLQFCFHAAFFIRQPHGNSSWYNMATAVAFTWQLQCNTHGNWICLHMATPYYLYLHFISCTFYFHTTFVLFSRYSNPLFDPCRHPRGHFRHLMKFTVGLRR